MGRLRVQPTLRMVRPTLVADPNLEAALRHISILSLMLSGAYDEAGGLFAWDHRVEDADRFVAEMRKEIR